MKLAKNILIVFFISISFSEDIDILKLKNGDIIKGRIIENNINENIKIELLGGSILTYSYSEIDKIGIEKLPNSRTFGNTNKNFNIINSSPVLNCYNNGYKSGQSINSGGEMLGGFFGGFALGIIGWGISYAIVANGSPTKPVNECYDCDANCNLDYDNGYKVGALEVKKNSVNIGGALGTLTAIIVVTSSY